MAARSSRLSDRREASGGAWASYTRRRTSSSAVLLRSNSCLPRLPGCSALTRFQHEACDAWSLNHPNICTIHDIDQQTAGVYRHGISRGMTPKERSRASQWKPRSSWLWISRSRTLGLGSCRRYCAPRHQACQYFRHQERTCEDSRFWIGQGCFADPCRRAAGDHVSEEHLINPGATLEPSLICHPSRLRAKNSIPARSVFLLGDCELRRHCISCRVVRSDFHSDPRFRSAVGDSL